MGTIWLSDTQNFYQRLKYFERIDQVSIPWSSHRVFSSTVGWELEKWAAQYDEKSDNIHVKTMIKFDQFEKNTEILDDAHFGHNDGITYHLKTF